MLIYNVTVTIDLDVAEAWLQWMLNTHLPEMMATGMFRSYRLNRMIAHDHPDAEIYTAQYLVPDMEHLIRYRDEFAPALQADSQKRFGGKYAAFRTVMEVVAHNENMD